MWSTTSVLFFTIYIATSRETWRFVSTAPYPAMPAFWGYETAKADTALSRCMGRPLSGGELYLGRVYSVLSPLLLLPLGILSLDTLSRQCLFYPGRVSTYPSSASFLIGLGSTYSLKKEIRKIGYLSLPRTCYLYIKGLSRRNY